ncbi:hypothetical protein [Sphingobium sp. CECT 9361]|uniref:hypothetical protein n=1 Tax=Sphingobium sp. CECT 9361 TaxID=2845384 RepID=UPI001E2C3359|nr:hypothetical protein [Sphingobium sp. CECT 9361]CAH0356389.1 hypothetical protein SPH9361_04053 [Sphingobium sp. CECT 9361]
MISTANDLLSSGGGSPCGWDMTVFQLASFLCIYRAEQPMRIEELCKVLAGWFECAIPPQDAAGPVADMVERGWLIPVADRLKASNEGREAARPLMNGIIRMLDHGTRLIDVALMMSVLRLTKGELDSGNVDL